MIVHLVQLCHPTQGRALAAVESESLRLLPQVKSSYDLAMTAIRERTTIADLVAGYVGKADELLDYDTVYAARGDWCLLPPFDHPSAPAQCLVTGTGLTHLASAENRQSMHAAGEEESDSMRMYRWGREGGRPAPGRIGVMPEWFYKGTGRELVASGEPLVAPSFAEGWGEEAEIAGCYVVDDEGRPYRVGFSQANEFSDHGLEARSYLYLAPSKLRPFSLGPELVVGHDLEALRGRARILRGGSAIWEAELRSGEEHMSHSLANLEHHHFKYPQHCWPGDAHVHFLGADAFSYRDAVRIEDGDVAEIAFETMGRPLRNPVRVQAGPCELREVPTL